MNPKEATKKPDAIESLASDIKVEVARLLKEPQAFHEPNRKSFSLNLDPKALKKFSNLPVNDAQITNVKMQVTVIDEETTQLKMETGGKEIDTFTHTEPKITYFHLNFKDKQKPHITFIYFLVLKDGKAPRAYIVQNNTNVANLDLDKISSFRAGIASDLTAVRNLLKELNEKDPQIKDQ